MLLQIFERQRWETVFFLCRFQKMFIKVTIIKQFWEKYIRGLNFPLFTCFVFKSAFHPIFTFTSDLHFQHAPPDHLHFIGLTGKSKAMRLESSYLAPNLLPSSLLLREWHDFPPPLPKLLHRTGFSCVPSAHLPALKVPSMLLSFQSLWPQSKGGHPFPPRLLQQVSLVLPL